MKNKISETLNKIGKKRIIIIGIMLIIIIAIILIITLTDNNIISFTSGNEDGKKFASEYEKLNGELTSDGKEYPKVDISSNNATKYSEVKEVVALFENKEDAVVYFGYPTCLYCRTAVQVLYDVAKDTELDKIYYLNVEEQNEEYLKLYEELGEELVEKDENNNLTINAPLVIFVASGDVVSYQKGTLFSQTSPYNPLDESQIDGLSEIYGYGIRDVLASIEDKKMNQ